MIFLQGSIYIYLNILNIFYLKKNVLLINNFEIFKNTLFYM